MDLNEKIKRVEAVLGYAKEAVTDLEEELEALKAEKAALEPKMVNALMIINRHAANMKAELAEHNLRVMGGIHLSVGMGELE